MDDAPRDAMQFLGGLLPTSPKKRAKAIYAALDAKSREHADTLSNIIRLEHVPETRITKLEIEVRVRIAPALVPWVIEGMGDNFLDYYTRRLFGRIHGVGVPKRAAEAAANLVADYVRAAVASHRRENVVDQG